MQPINEQIEQYRRIVADAPEGATHYSECINDKDVKQYFIRHKDNSWDTWWDKRGHWYEADEDELSEFNNIHCLDDIRANIALHDENHELREAIANICYMKDGGDSTMDDVWESIDEARELLK